MCGSVFRAIHPRVTCQRNRGWMARHTESEHPFPSTRWEWKRVKMARPPEASSTAPSAARFRNALPGRDPRKPLPVTVKFRGGAECWYEVVSRGTTWRFPGTVCLHDAMRKINRLV